nr:uncharacterized protein F12A10.7-like [Penaeus vannamei]
MRLFSLAVALVALVCLLVPPGLATPEADPVAAPSPVADPEPLFFWKFRPRYYRGYRGYRGYGGYGGYGGGYYGGYYKKGYW